MVFVYHKNVHLLFGIPASVVDGSCSRLGYVVGDGGYSKEEE